MSVERHSFKDADLFVGAHRQTKAFVDLAVHLRPDDPYADQQHEINEELYDEGVRVEGELYIDSPVVQWPDSPIICSNVTADLEVKFEQESTRLKILLTDPIGVKDLVPHRFRRYFWKFYGIGRPIKDELELYPPHYRGQHKMKIFTITNFRGLWPTGVSAVLVARDHNSAKSQLDAALRERGIPARQDYELVEVDTSKSSAIILHDGSEYR